MLRYTSQALWLIVAYFFIIIAPVAVSAIIDAPAHNSIFLKLANSSALLAFPILAMQLVLSVRLHWIEKPFGLDRIFRFHKLMAIAAACLLILHPVMMAAGSEDSGWELLFSYRLPWTILLGKATLIAAIATAAGSLCRRILKIEFQRWLLWHNTLAIPILIGAFVHGSTVGPDFQNEILSAYLAFLIIVAMSAYGYHKIVRPYFARLYAFRVVGIIGESPEVCTLTFAPPKGRIVLYKPGQFYFLKLLRGKGLPIEEHPFSISSSPAEFETLSSTIKNIGDFTATIPQTAIGDRAALIGPYGRFSYLLYDNPTTIVLIAGGIGITPLMSMLRHMRDTSAKHRVVLLYGNKTERDIIFKSELDLMQKASRPPLTITHILSKPEEAWRGERGHIDETIIKRYCGCILRSAAFYLCGPAGMMESIKKILIRLQTPRSRIHYEKFEL
jgi:predicted ferric reductase